MTAVTRRTGTPWRLTAVLGGVGVVVLVLAVFLVVRAGAPVPGREITRYDVTVDVDREGLALVTIDMDFDFGSKPGHGPFITLPTRQGYDATHDRLYEVWMFTQSSATGAPADRYVDRTDNEVRLRVGDEDRGDITGVHQYTITYLLRGMVNPEAGDGELDEFYWNALGHEWEIPVRDATVTVRGPSDVVAAACYSGRRGATDPCEDASRSGAQASFVGGSFEPGKVFTVAVGWPAGTFEGAEIILERRPEPGYVTFFKLFDPRTDGGFLAAWILLLGAGGALALAWWSGRDRAFLGLTPGLAPTEGIPARVGRRRRNETVAVQFEPPSGLRPGLVGTILDGFADPRDVTATIVDLAVRGYLRIEEVEKTSRWNSAGEPEWRFVRLESGGPELRDFEASVLGGIFPGGQTKTRFASMRFTFADTAHRVREELDEEAMVRRWFRWSPYRASRVWRVVGKVVMTGAGIIGLLVLVTRPSPGAALPYLAALAVGGVVVLAGKHAWGRTPLGSAAHAQVLGFQQYIATAEANQLRFEEGDDVFSRYLPYAIVFGETERWTRVFEDLAAQGRVAQDLSWYSGAESSLATFTTSTAAFSTALASFTSAANLTFTSPATFGSSGDSGFSGGGSSGGGGSAGGGGGGGGGGGW